MGKKMSPVCVKSLTLQIGKETELGKVRWECYSFEYIFYFLCSLDV